MSSLYLGSAERGADAFVAPSDVEVHDLEAAPTGEEHATAPMHPSATHTLSAHHSGAMVREHEPVQMATPGDGDLDQQHEPEQIATPEEVADLPIAGGAGAAAAGIDPEHGMRQTKEEFSHNLGERTDNIKAEADHMEKLSGNVAEDMGEYGRDQASLTDTYRHFKRASKGLEYDLTDALHLESLNAMKNDFETNSLEKAADKAAAVLQKNPELSPHEVAFEYAKDASHQLDNLAFERLGRA